MKLTLKNSTAPNWGITVTEEDKVTIRDTENLTVTFSFGYKFMNETIEGDVVTEDNGMITLINTKVGGQTVEKGNGKIINQ